MRLIWDHDALMRIGGEAPGRRAHSTRRSEGPCGDAGCRHLGFGCSGFLSLVCVGLAHAAAGRKMTPTGTSPMVTRRPSAMSRLQASATIMFFPVVLWL